MKKIHTEQPYNFFYLKILIKFYNNLGINTNDTFIHLCKFVNFGFKCKDFWDLILFITNSMRFCFKIIADIFKIYI